MSRASPTFYVMKEGLNRITLYGGERDEQ